jgi:hypothetical protein
MPSHGVLPRFEAAVAVIAGELIKPAPPDQPTKKPGLSPGFLLPSKYRFTVYGRCLMLLIVPCSRFHYNENKYVAMTYAERFRRNVALFASLIADGHHLDRATLRVLARAKGPERVILISDASPLAGLPVGTYGPWDVDPSGRIVVAGTPYLAGSNRSLATGVGNLMAAVSWPIAEALGTVTRNPALLLGRSPPRLEPIPLK